MQKPRLELGFFTLVAVVVIRFVIAMATFCISATAMRVSSHGRHRKDGGDQKGK